MQVLWQINLREMLGDLSVATFLILLAASTVVVGSMIVFPLVDLAFEKKVEPPSPNHNKIAQHDPGWLARRPWLALRSAASHSQPSDSLDGQVERATLPHLAGKFSEPLYRTPLVKRTGPVRETTSTGASEAA
jgi:hypothetical protein